MLLMLWTIVYCSFLPVGNERSHMQKRAFLPLETTVSALGNARFHLGRHASPLEETAVPVCGNSCYYLCIRNAVLLNLTYQVDAWLQRCTAFLPLGRANFAIVSSYELGCLYFAE